MKIKNTTTPTSKKQDKAAAEILKIGIDVHKSKYVLVCQYDNGSPRTPEKFEPEAFLVWIAKQSAPATGTYRRALATTLERCEDIREPTSKKWPSVLLKIIRKT